MNELKRATYWLVPSKRKSPEGESQIENLWQAKQTLNTSSALLWHCSCCHLS